VATWYRSRGGVPQRRDETRGPRLAATSRDGSGVGLYVAYDQVSQAVDTWSMALQRPGPEGRHLFDGAVLRVLGSSVVLRLPYRMKLCVFTWEACMVQLLGLGLVAMRRLACPSGRPAFVEQPDNAHNAESGAHR
jgi:hypothetical protein